VPRRVAGPPRPGPKSPYDPYGATRVATGPAAAKPFRYTGDYLDASTGVSKLGYRYYDASFSAGELPRVLPL
jgi:hypothetical protein